LQLVGKRMASAPFELSTQRPNVPVKLTSSLPCNEFFKPLYLTHSLRSPTVTPGDVTNLRAAAYNLKLET
jgi:hypothetical protein